MGTTNSLANWLLTECKDDSFLAEASIPDDFLKNLEKIKIAGWELDHGDDYTGDDAWVTYIPRKLKGSKEACPGMVIKVDTKKFEVGFEDETSDVYDDYLTGKFTSFADLEKLLNDKTKELQKAYLEFSDLHSKKTK